MVEEVKTIELSTNPKKIVLLDKEDTKERLIQLEKKYKRLNKISNGAIAVIAAGGTLGFATFLGDGIYQGIQNSTANPAMGMVGAAGLGATAVLGTVGFATMGITMARQNKLEKELQKVRDAVALREEAKTNPNIVIEEKSAKQLELERKLKRFTPEKLDKVSPFAATLGAMVGGFSSYALCQKSLGIVLCSTAMGATLGVAPIEMLSGRAQKRQDRLNAQLKETIKAEHPEFYKQDLRAEMDKIVQENPQEEHITELDRACKLAKKCDSLEMMERLVDIAKNPSQENTAELNLMITNNGKEKE